MARNNVTLHKNSSSTLKGRKKRERKDVGLGRNAIRASPRKKKKPTTTGTLAHKSEFAL